MISRRAVVVHGLDHALQALRPGRAVTLLSAPGAAGYAGCLWWRELVRAARAGFPDTPTDDILDCGDAPGAAMAALRIGLPALVLAPTCPAWAATAAIAAAQGAVLLAERPPALDLARRGASRLLEGWLAGAQP
jgi:hypothetical protein